eukprot:scaffold5909_cov23-Tisochrysis_lutea.AAC.1
MGDKPIPEYEREDWAPRQQQLREAAAKARDAREQVGDRSVVSSAAGCPPLQALIVQTMIGNPLQADGPYTIHPLCLHAHMLAQESLHQPKPEVGIKQEEEQDVKPQRPAHIKQEKGDGMAE